MMTDDRWREVWTLFHAAADQPPARRRAYVTESCSDAEVAKVVLELLEESGSSGELSEGTCIGRYRVLHRLGSGGMGAVYAAEDLELGRIVALKCLDREMHAGGRAMDALIHEAKTASALSHPNIVTVYEVVADGGDVAIAMELVDGVSMRAFCGAPVNAEAVRRWGCQIAQALAAAHARGIVHRDIKPENLMVREDGYVKVLDFGLARRVPVTGAAATSFPSVRFAGTLDYMSPERTRGEAATPASDIFSLAIVMYELLTGQHPFAADSPFGVAHAIATQPPARRLEELADVPESLKRTIFRMLEKDPAKRPTAEQVEQALSGGERSQPLRPRLRLRWWAAAAGAAVVAVAAWLSWRTGVRPLRPLTDMNSEQRVTAAAFSPDGKFLAMAGFGATLQLLRTADGTTRTIWTPEGLLASRIAWFQDGARLAVSGVADGKGGVWIVRISDGSVQLLAENAADAAPSPDGRRVAFTNGEGATIWVADLEDGSVRQVRSGAAGTRFSALVWSPDGNRITYQRQDPAPRHDRQVQTGDSQLERSQLYLYESAEAATGRVTASTPDFVMESAAALPDGRILFLRWNGYTKIMEQSVWEVRTDAKTGRILRDAVRLTGDQPLSLSSISASADGSRIGVVASQTGYNLHIAELAPPGQRPQLTHIRRLGFAAAREFPHAWTPDGAAVVFESDRHGKFDLFLQPLDQKDAVTLLRSKVDKVLAQMEAAGRWVLYREGPADQAVLMRISLDGGTPAVVPVRGRLDEFRCGLRPGARCVLREVQNDQFVFYELDPVKGQGAELTRVAWSPTVVGDWDLSPDGKVVAIPNHEADSVRIRLVSMEPAAGPLSERAIDVRGRRRANGLVWTASGDAFYLCSSEGAEFVLSHVDLNGGSTELLRQPSSTYALPSPDGRKIAFPAPTISSNVLVVD